MLHIHLLLILGAIFDSKPLFSRGMVEIQHSPLDLLPAFEAPSKTKNVITTPTPMIDIPKNRFQFTTVPTIDFRAITTPNNTTQSTTPKPLSTGAAMSVAELIGLHEGKIKEGQAGALQPHIKTPRLSTSIRVPHVEYGAFKKTTTQPIFRLTPIPSSSMGISRIQRKMGNKVNGTTRLAPAEQYSFATPTPAKETMKLFPEKELSLTFVPSISMIPYSGRMQRVNIEHLLPKQRSNQQKISIKKTKNAELLERQFDQYKKLVDEFNDVHNQSQDMVFEMANLSGDAITPEMCDRYGKVVEQLKKLHMTILDQYPNIEDVLLQLTAMYQMRNNNAQFGNIANWELSTGSTSLPNQESIQKMKDSLEAVRNNKAVERHETFQKEFERLARRKNFENKNHLEKVMDMYDMLETQKNPPRWLEELVIKIRHHLLRAGLLAPIKCIEKSKSVIDFSEQISQYAAEATALENKIKSFDDDTSDDTRNETLEWIIGLQHKVSGLNEAAQKARQENSGSHYSICMISISHLDSLIENIDFLMEKLIMLQNEVKGTKKELVLEQIE